MAFPSQAVKDAFTQADGALSASWSGPIISGEAAMVVASNQAKGAASVSARSSYYNVATYGADSEVYCDLPTLPSVNAEARLYARIANPGGASLTGYQLRAINRTDASRMRLQIYRIDNGVLTILGANIDDTLTPSNYQFGLEIVGSTLTAYRTNAGGGWTSLATRTDATYGAAGYIGFGVSGSSGGEAARLDNFGGGTVGAGGPPPATAPFVGSLALLGVGR